MNISLGRLQKVDLRSVWSSVAADFTPWLAKPENLEVLGEAIGLDLGLEAQEKDVGPFRADILCKDLRIGNWVLIDNPLERTDHTHLGQLLVYASGLKALTIIWIAQRLTEEHRATLDWLNGITGEELQFFGLEVEFWKIGQSEPAPKFNIISKPNDWSREVSQAAHRIEAGEVPQAKQPQPEFWTGLMKFQSGRSGTIRPVKPQPQHWVSFSIGRPGFRLDTMALVRDQGIAVNLVMGNDHAKAFFHLLAWDKAAIEAELGFELQWKELSGKRESHIYTGLKPADFARTDKGPEYYQWLANTAGACVRVLDQRIRARRADEWKPADDLSSRTSSSVAEVSI